MRPSLYTMAFRAYDEPDYDADLPYGDRTKLPARGESLSASMVQTIEGLLTKNETTLALLRQARGIESCKYNWDRTQDIPELEQIRELARLPANAALLRAQQGDTDAALDHIEEILGLARSVQNEPGLICYLTRQACTGLAVGVLERTLNVTTFTDEQLVRADRMFGEAISTMDLTHAWVGERCCLIEYIRDPTLLGDLNSAVMKVPGLRTVGMADTLDYMGDCIEAMKLAPMERGPRVQEIFDRLFDRSAVHVVAGIIAPALARVTEIDQRCQMGVINARTALAIERYRLATGRLPQDLATLVPEYLNQVPVDLFDGQAIRYRLTEPGYLVYSVGEDRQDNEGKSNGEVERNEPYDWPFVVVRQLLW